MTFKHFSKPHLIFYIFVGVFLGLFVTVESINQKLWTNDFRVYYGAVNDFFEGNNPYEKSYGLNTGYFKYPPFTLYLFSILKLLPYWLAQWVHLFLSAMALMISIPLLKSIGENFSVGRRQTWILYFSFFCISIHLVREFHMGNVNLILLGFFTIGLYFINSKSIWGTVICWSLMIILKPIMILSLIPLIFFKKWILIFAVGTAGIFFFLFPVIHLGWNGNLSIWTGWYQSVAEHGDYIVSSNSLKYLSNYYLGTQSEWIPSLAGLTLLTGVMYFSYFKQHSSPVKLSDWIIIFTAFIPNFFVTDTQHFLLSVPLIIFLLLELSQRKSIFPWIIFGLGFILFSLNSNDLLGKELVSYLSDHGSVGIGNMIFILLFIVLKKNKKGTAANQWEIIET